MAYCFALAGAVRPSRAACSRGDRWKILRPVRRRGSLGAYLVEQERLAEGETLLIKQGVEMGRPSEIHVGINSRARTAGAQGERRRLFAFSKEHIERLRSLRTRRSSVVPRDAVQSLRLLEGRRPECRSGMQELLRTKISWPAPALRQSPLSAARFRLATRKSPSRRMLRSTAASRSIRQFSESFVDQLVGRLRLRATVPSNSSFANLRVCLRGVRRLPERLLDAGGRLARHIPFEEHLQRELARFSPQRCHASCAARGSFRRARVAVPAAAAGADSSQVCGKGCAISTAPSPAS